MRQAGLWDEPDPVEAAKARDAGIAMAASGVSTAWRSAAREAIRNRSVALDDFTADDVLEALSSAGVPLTGVNLAALGPIFLAAARAGEIRKTGSLRPSRFARRHRDLTVWERSPRNVLAGLAYSDPST